MGAGDLGLQPGHGPPGCAQRPRVAEPVPLGPLGRVLRLVAVERPTLERDLAGGDGRDRHGALENLRQVMVRGIKHGRTAHRVVGAEGREALAGAERHDDVAVPTAQQVPPGEHQLVHVGVRMTAVVVALAVGAGGELAVLNGPALEVPHRVQLQVVAERSAFEHQHRLDEPALSQRGAAGNGVGGGEQRDGLAGEAERGTLSRAEAEGHSGREA